jgi:2-methylcitrate dehydratase PrpD
VTDALFKFHAACYLTHNTIEAAGVLRRGVGFSPDEVEAVLIQVQETHLGVCNIEAPRTGLECKFSLRMTCAMALADDDTFDEGSYSDETAQRPDLVALRRRISVEPTAAGSASTVKIRLRDGRAYSRTVDVGVPERDLDRQQAKLERKFRHLTREALWPGAADEVVAICQRLEEEPTLERLMRAISGGLQSQ